MTVVGTPSAVSCAPRAWTGGVPSVTTSTSRFTPPCGATGGGVGTGVVDGVMYGVPGLAGPLAPHAASTVTAVTATAAMTALDRWRARFPMSVHGIC